MRLNKYSELIFNDEDLLALLYSGKSEFLSSVLVDDSNDATVLKNNNINITVYNSDDEKLTVEEFDKNRQDKWFIPEKYQSLDIREYCLSKCASTVEGARVIEEYQEFEKKDMIPLLKFLKYLVDKLREEKLVWGVGRGSSVSSYILYLLGIHKINSIKHNLDWREFIR